MCGTQIIRPTSDVRRFLKGDGRRLARRKAINRLDLSPLRVSKFLKFRISKILSPQKVKMAVKSSKIRHLTASSFGTANKVAGGGFVL